MVLSDAGDLRGPVLVLCTHNSVRSPMAEFFLSKALGGEIKVVSAGLDPREIDPFAAAAMSECGLDISTHPPTGSDDESLRIYGPFGLVIALSRPALERAREIGKSCHAPVEYWDVPEPPSLAGFGGSREQLLGAYRAIRDDIARHIRNRFDVSASLQQ